ncbi:receptor-like protein 7 [Alnus glutinosa]|uniref:receptor-like protein 7 n=1 Tax=Alnus glutinosa TaxID=3517 RepID=UPI002D776AB8|nr:receptor-like protein 7 [Alnus glutinosa]
MLSGQIPIEISQLSHLLSLDLSYNSDLELKKHSLRCLVQNLTCLQKLDLSGVNISSMVPNILTNLSSLKSFSLVDCGLHEKFSVGIFKLSKLRFLFVRENNGLTGYLPGFTWSNQLEKLDLSFTSFSGELLAYMGNLRFLVELNMRGCNISGPIPSSVGNLTKLTYLDLSFNSFVGNIRPSLGNLPQLFSLDISNNRLIGPNLEVLDLSENYLNGIVEFDEFVKLKHLNTLDIAGNELLLLTKEADANATHQNFVALAFSSCNLSEFPNFLRNQHELDSLEVLDLANNNFNGSLPRCLDSFGAYLSILDLRWNKFQGSIPESWIKEGNLVMINSSQNKFQRAFA